MQHLAAQYFLNHLLEPEEVRRQMRKFADGGYESIYAHSRAGMRTPYLSDAWFRVIDAMADECRQLGLTLSIWDEDYYPSPTAGGRVLWEHPEFAAQQLCFTVLKLKKGESAEAKLEPGMMMNCFAFPDDGSCPLDITSETGTVKSNWGDICFQHGAYTETAKIGSPHLRNWLYSKQYALLWTATCDCTVVACQIRRETDGHETDILNPAMTEAFLQTTHEQYLQRYSEHFREIFSATFLDEPAPCGTFPWTGRFAEEFRKDHGFDLRPQLAHLAVDLDKSSRLIRHRYYQTLQRLLCESYLQRIAEWDHAHGLLNIGHLTRTEYLAFVCTRWPNELRCYANLDVPCSDPLGFFVALPDASAYHTGLKVTSSAARLFGKAQCGSDALAVMGNEVCLRDLAYQFGYQITLGATYFNVHGLDYSLDGPRKCEAPPSLFYQHSEWPIMSALLKPVRALCETVAGGRPCQRLLVLYPSTSFYCEYQANEELPHAREAEYHALSEKLLASHHDFDFIDEVTLAEKSTAELRKDYDACLLYHISFLDEKAAAALENFQAQGGRVLLVADSLPKKLGTLDNPETTWETMAANLVPELTADLLASLPGIQVTGEGSEDILVQEREYEGQGCRLLLFNRSEQVFRGQAGRWTVTVPPGVARFADEAGEAKFSGEYEDISSGWKLSFPENSLPLAYWLTNPDSLGTSGINLMSYPSDKLPEFAGEWQLEARFLMQGRPRHLRLLLEESSCTTSDWQLMVNGHLVPRENIVREPVRDCKNLTVDITEYIISGTSPRLNCIRFTSQDSNWRLQELPFLLGDFRGEFRHGLLTLANLRAETAEDEELSGLPDWRTIGRGGFSGCGMYRRTIQVAAEGNYLLQCGRVEDAVELYLDGQSQGTCVTPDYSFVIHLKPGQHTLELRVWNGPGNRDRWSNLPAGLLGPVRLGKV